MGAYLSGHGVRKLHLGCGPNPVPGWLNCDFQPASFRVIYLDVRRPLPLPDQSFDYVFAEHLIEHLTYPQAQRLLGECLRILKPGGRIRLVTPDLDQIISLFAKPPEEGQQRYLDWIYRALAPDLLAPGPVFLLNHMSHFWGHRFLYDKSTLMHIISAAHFGELRVYRALQTEDEVFREVEGHLRIFNSRPEDVHAQASEFEPLEAFAVEASRPRD